MSEVENVAWRRAALPEHDVGVPFELLGRREQRGRIEISLHRLVRTQHPADLAERRAPVHSDHIHVEIGNRLHEG